MCRLIQTERWLKTAIWANYSSWLDKRSQCHTSRHKFWWTTIRAVRLIEIEIKSWFELARFLNRFIARFFSRPQPHAVCYPNQSECSAPKLSARTEQTGYIDRWYAKETGKMSTKQDKYLVANKNACCFVGFDYSHIHIIYIHIIYIYIYICILPYVCSRDMLQLLGKV